MRLPIVKTYNKDGRMPIEQVYSSVDSLRDFGWLRDFICYTAAEIDGKEVRLPVYCYRTKHKGGAYHIMAPPHGEEPAFTNAVASSKGLEIIKKIGEDVPVVLYPLCNATGYVRNWRYLDRKKYSENAQVFSSIGDPEHFLPVIDSLGRIMPRICKKRPSKEAIAFTGHILKLAKQYNPQMMLSFHEDDAPRMKFGYVYSVGELKNKEPVALNVVRILVENGLSSYDAGTRAPYQCGAERIFESSSNSACDYSVEYLFASDVVITSRRRAKVTLGKGLSTSRVVTCETPSRNFPLEKRVDAILDILSAVKDGSIFTFSLKNN